MKGIKEERILATSNRLFLDNGYENATMRQIAQDADVSIGLATYHFHTKRMIAVTILEKYLRYLRDRVDVFVPPGTDPLVHSAAMVRVSIEFFYAPRFRRFYLECLSGDIYAESIQRLGNLAMNAISNRFGVDISSDLSLLLDNYIPPSVEKVLLLEKEKGNFAGITYDDVPDIVFGVSVERHFDKATVDAAALAARKVSRKILSSIPENICELLFPSPQDGE